MSGQDFSPAMICSALGFCHPCGQEERTSGQEGRTSGQEGRTSGQEGRTIHPQGRSHCSWRNAAKCIGQIKGQFRPVTTVTIVTNVTIVTTPKRFRSLSIHFYGLEPSIWTVPKLRIHIVQLDDIFL